MRSLIVLAYCLALQTLEANLFGQALRDPVAIVEKGPPIAALAFAPDGRTLASGDIARFVKLWDVQSGKERKTLKGHEDRVWAVTFDPSGTILASGGMDDTIRLWDVRTGEELATLKGHTFRVTSIVWTADGKTLISAGEDKTIRIWDVSSRKEIGLLKGHTEALGCLALTPDDRILVSTAFVRDPVTTGIVAGEIRFWDLGERKELRCIQAHDGSIRSVSVSRDGKLLATSGSDRTVMIWTIADGKKVSALIHSDNVGGLAFSPDGKILAVGSRKRKGDNAIGVLKLWDVGSAKEKNSYEAHDDLVLSIAWSLDGKLIATTGYGGGILLWKVSSE